MTAHSIVEADNLESLDKKSTAAEVLSTLSKSNKLASYVVRGNDNPGVAVVTGGTSGIGIVSVETLALAGMKVVLCARNVEKAKEVRTELPPVCRNNVRIQKLDLADLDSVQAAAKEICDTEGKIDLLLNNAGVMAISKREETKQGFEMQFGTNHVGPFMFTRLLLPHMQSGGRVVTVASSAHHFGTLKFDDLHFSKGRKYKAWGAYGQSKLAGILFAKGLNDRLKKENSNITAVSLHPGVIATNLWQHSGWLVTGLMNIFINDKNIEQGAATSMYCSLVEGTAFKGGEYFTDCAVSDQITKDGKDESGELREKLWVATEEMIKKAGFELPEKITSK